jgi:hypothetical protein
VNFGGDTRVKCKDFLVDNRTEDSFKISVIAQNSGIRISDQDYSSDAFEQYEISGKERKRYFARLTDGTYDPSAGQEDYLLFENDKGRFMIAFTKSRYDRSVFIVLRCDTAAELKEEGYNFRYTGVDGISHMGGDLKVKLINGQYRVIDCFKQYDGGINIVIEKQTDDDSWMKEISPYDDMPLPSESWRSRFCCCVE